MFLVRTILEGGLQAGIGSFRVPQVGFCAFPVLGFPVVFIHFAVGKVPVHVVNEAVEGSDDIVSAVHGNGPIVEPLDRLVFDAGDEIGSILVARHFLGILEANIVEPDISDHIGLGVCADDLFLEEIGGYGRREKYKRNEKQKREEVFHNKENEELRVLAADRTI